MKSVNKVILLGCVGRDPDVKYTAGGAPVAHFSLATSFKAKADSDERTEWHSLVAWNRMAEIVGEHVKKGSRVYLEGRLQSNSWADRQTGEKRQRTEIVVLDLMLIGSNQGSNGKNPERQERLPTMATEQQAAAAQPETGITDEDIPF